MQAQVFRGSDDQLSIAEVCHNRDRGVESHWLIDWELAICLIFTVNIDHNLIAYYAQTMLQIKV